MNYFTFREVWNLCSSHLTKMSDMAKLLRVLVQMGVVESIVGSKFQSPFPAPKVAEMIKTLQNWHLQEIVQIKTRGMI